MSGVRASRLDLPIPRLTLVTDRRLAGGTDRLVVAIEAAISGGVDSVQLREKDLPPAELLLLARRLRAVTRGHALLVVNGPLEVALACKADGVHLPESAPMAERAQFPGLIGRSVHSLESANRAVEEGVDYLIAGAAYETGSHPGAQAAGLTLISEIASGVALPVIAIGGIRAERIEEVMQAGAVGVAVVSAILGTLSPTASARNLREALDFRTRTAGRR